MVNYEYSDFSKDINLLADQKASVYKFYPSSEAKFRPLDIKEAKKCHSLGNKIHTK